MRFMVNGSNHHHVSPTMGYHIWLSVKDRGFELWAQNTQQSSGSYALGKLEANLEVLDGVYVGFIMTVCVFQPWLKITVAVAVVVDPKNRYVAVRGPSPCKIIFCHKKNSKNIQKIKNIVK